MASKKSSGVSAIKADEEWRVEHDMRTLMEAEEIKRDPKRLAKATAMAKEKLVELATVAGADGKST